MHRVRGFTMFELLVVLALAALLVGLVPPAFNRMQESAQYRDVVRTMRADLLAARQQAAVAGRSVVFTVDLTNRQFGIDGRPRRALPQPLALRVTAADTERAVDGVLGIRFFPGGGSTGGSIEVLRPTGEGAQLRTDWLDGRVTLHPVTTSLRND